MRKEILSIGLMLGLVALSNHVNAHGGGGPEPVKEKPKPKMKRNAATSLQAIETHNISTFSDDGKIPEDVVAIQCKLSASVDCRGLTIVISDKDGHSVASAHSGTHGLVAFEGLDDNEEYVAKIESEKYFGEVEVSGGAKWTLHGDRKP